MELSSMMIAQVLLLALLGAVIMGIVQSATVIFEADATFRRDNISKDLVQAIKKRDIMPKLWAPMYEGIIGEILLGAFVLLVPMDDASRILLLVLTVIFALAIVLLGRFFSRSGRGGKMEV